MEGTLSMLSDLIERFVISNSMGRLISKDVKHSDYTRRLIEENFNEDADGEITTTSLRVSLACPLGKLRMRFPCRSLNCSHLQCFDAKIFLTMNVHKPRWNCPVCDKPVFRDDLVIDGYFQEVLNSNKLLPDGNEIQLLQDGSWENLVVKKDKDKDRNVETLDLVELIDLSPALSNEKKPVVIIDLISDSEEDSNPLQSSNKKPNTGITVPQKSGPGANSAIGRTSKIPGLVIIDLV